MILWQGGLPFLRCMACKDGLTASRSPVMEAVIGWLAAKRMCRCLVNGWPIGCECGPQGRKAPIKGCFPPHCHCYTHRTFTRCYLSPCLCLSLYRRLVNYLLNCVLFKERTPWPSFLCCGMFDSSARLYHFSCVQLDNSPSKLPPSLKTPVSNAVIKFQPLSAIIHLTAHLFTSLLELTHLAADF